ncbi:MFS transporter [Pseudomonas brassicacearum]|uniref:MFS transporter n=1 Tax=Pseudomonas brassicacearum TaxID=930166 RepID=A0A423GRN6_9PSED|nr:MFS transporter [Pseudomonas brassicacearum]ROM97176.1 MFS transporter [Pseudomonas brassicacearum]
MKPQTLAPIDSISQEKHSLSVLAVLVALFLAAMDSTAVSTILPQINAQMQDTTLYPWVVSGFLLPLALIAPLAGALADRFGISSMMKVSLLIFIAASAVVASSQSMVMLIAGRALQGIGAGGIIVLSYSMLASLFEGPKRASMQGMLSSVWGLAAVLGPVAGTVLGSTLSWRAVFWLNLPLGFLALMVLFFTPVIGRGQSARTVDPIAQFFLAIAACAGLFMLSSQHLDMIPHPISTLAIVMLISLVALVARVRATPAGSPVPLGFFDRPALGAVMALVVISSIGLYATVSLLPIALSHTSGSALSTGVLIMLAAVGWVVGATICGKRLSSVGFRPMAIAGMSMLMLGCIGVAAGLQWSQWLAIGAGQVLVGLGMGLTATTTLVLAQNSAPHDQLGAYTSTVQFLRNLGAAFGVNAMVAIALYLPPNLAYQVTFLLLGLLMTVGLLFAFGLPSRGGPHKR